MQTPDTNCEAAARIAHLPPLRGLPDKLTARGNPA